MLVLVGATGTGKSALAASLAERLGGEIVSADSRQVYRGLDAGTAKPPRELRARAPHHLIDVADPSETYDAARFVRDASAAIAGIRSRGRLPIVCGGTGLYVRALLEGLSPLPGRDEAVRARLSQLSAARLRSMLEKADPDAAAAIVGPNVSRLIRALEVLELTGKPISAHWREGRAGGASGWLALRLEPGPDYAVRLDERTRAMWPALLAEVRALVPSRFRGTEPGFTSLGCREALAVASGALGEAEGLDSFLRATRAYAKRQRTWFRTRPPAAPVDGLEAALAAWEASREALAA